MSLARKTLPQRRQPLKRVPIAKGDKPLKRSAKPMAKRSTKRRKQDAAVNDLAEFAERFIGRGQSPVSGCSTLCWVCRERFATEIHHIAGRASALRHHRGNLAATCERCHEEILPGISVRAQFVLKRMRDPLGFSKEIANQVIKAKNGGAPL